MSVDDNRNCPTTYNQNNFKMGLREVGLGDGMEWILLAQGGDL
jgi:hypothetical protein